jgi:CheY-like chemotaxis protein
VPRILLVEDDWDVRLLWEHTLLEAAYDVDTAWSVESGRDFLNHGHYDLIIADGRLRDGIGLAVVDQAREMGIPALIVTGYAFTLDGLAAGSPRYDVLLKPVRPAELLKAVAEALDFAPRQ